MDKYREGMAKRTRPDKSYPLEGRKMLPINEGQVALARASFAGIEKETFFNGAYSDILADLFTQWLKTQHHEKETREFLYATAMALGSVKEKLIQIETFGKNVPEMEKYTPVVKLDDTQQGEV